MNSDWFAAARWLTKYQSFLIGILRWTLGIIFIWFGALKIAGYNPVYDLIYNSMLPLLAEGVGLQILGVFEVVIGILLISNRWLYLAHFLLLAHLLGTFSTFLFGWEVVFSPKFPVLSLSGEFVLKNMVLVIAGLVVMMHEMKKYVIRTGKI